MHAFKRDILYAVRDLEQDEPPKGLAIKRVLERDYETVHHSRLYQNLSQLVTSGLLEQGRKNGRTNEYETTNATRRMLEASTRQRAEQLGIAATGGDA
ncbi:helix-turn-helix transcriptional regulator [Haladaptatus sp. DYF46]|uniref:helix-turn-helix transcriptional regulator n=1 Tax=Haladaptatus sp. DYF46 TaxID=2886041 RepID=UPI0031831FD4